MSNPPDESVPRPSYPPGVPRPWVGIGCFVFGALGLALFLPMDFLYRGPPPSRNACISNVKRLALASLMYASDHDEHLPIAIRWQDATPTYLSDPKVLTCPALSPPQANGYAANTNWGGKALGKIEDAAAAIWLYKTANLRRNVAGDPLKESAPNRHGPGRTFGFADGHGKFSKP